MSQPWEQWVPVGTVELTFTTDAVRIMIRDNSGEVFGMGSLPADWVRRGLAEGGPLAASLRGPAGRPERPANGAEPPRTGDGREDRA